MWYSLVVVQFGCGKDCAIVEFDIELHYQILSSQIYSQLLTSVRVL